MTADHGEREQEYLDSISLVLGLLDRFANAVNWDEVNRRVEAMHIPK